MDKTILQQIFYNAVNMGEKIALQYKEESITYSQLAGNIKQTASWLQRKAIGSEDVVLMSGDNVLDFIYLYFATNLLGAVSVVVDGHSGEERLRYIIKATNPKLMVGSMRYDGVIPYSEINYGLSTETVPSEANIVLSAICDILFTTGTTGVPKGVCLTNAAELAAVRNIVQFVGCRTEDVELLALPLCHSFGLGRLRVMLYLGATVVIQNGFANIKKFFTLLETKQVTGFGMVPAAWEYMKRTTNKRIGEFDHQLRYIEIGSAPMPIEDKELLCELLPQTRICMHYGLTEASRSTFTEFHEDYKHLDSIGKSSPHVIIRFFTEKGEMISDGREGELCVKGDHVLNRYLSDKDNAVGWYGDYFRTGDWGYEGTDGYLYLKGRGKDIINVGGKKLSPEEVENIILSMDVFSDCACVGVPDPKGILGEVVKCYAVPKNNQQLSLSELQTMLRGKLESFKIPSELEYISVIPKTESGKKQRQLLKDE